MVASQPIGVSNGFPQRSVLGPLLFLIFDIVLPNFSVNSSLDLYADDCKLYSFKLADVELDIPSVGKGF